MTAAKARLTPVQLRKAGAQVAALRRARGWQQRELAVKASVCQGSVSLAETGSRGVSAGLLGGLAAALGTTLADLLGPCGRCQGRPGDWRSCLGCGAEGERA